MRRLGWVLFAFTVGLCVLQAGLLASTTSLWSVETFIDEAFPLVTIGAIAGAAVGALIVSRNPDNRIGWLFCLGQLGMAIGLAAAAYVRATADPTATPDLWTILALRFGMFFNATYVMTFLALIFLLAPDGRVPSRRWRYVPAIPVAAFLLQAGVVLAIPATDFAPGAEAVHATHTIVLYQSAQAVMALAVGLGAAALWTRLRSAQGELRLQLRWIAASAFAGTVTFVAVLVTGVVLDAQPWYLLTVWYLAYIGVSVGIGMAILRYRLYDIDVILSRTIALGVLVVFVTVGYILVVVGIGLILTALGGGSAGVYWPSLVATGLVAAAFQPLRRHVIRLADHLVYGPRAVPYEALADLSRRLAESPAQQELPARVAEATGRAVRAESTRVILGSADAPPLATAQWPTDAGGTGEPRAARAAPDGSGQVEIPVLDLGEPVGQIAVTMPRGQQLRRSDRQLLSDVAAESGLAFRNAMLQAELAGRVAELDRQSVELAASRRRLVWAEDEARERLAAAIAQRVVPHLQRAGQLIQAPFAELADTRPAADITAIDGAIAEVEVALDELRAVCRGLFPALLQRRGLVPALNAQFDITHLLTGLDSEDLGRLDPAVEAAAYLFCVEVAPTDEPSSISIRIASGGSVDKLDAPGPGPPPGAPTPERLIIAVERTGTTEIGSAPGWQHAEDRVAALEGTVHVAQPEPGRLTVQATIPLVRAEVATPPAEACAPVHAGPGAEAPVGPGVRDVNPVGRRE